MFSVLLITALFSCNREIKVIPGKEDSSDNSDIEIIISDIPETHVVNFEADTLSYLALGDSYTIGTGVERKARWPNQFVDSMESKNLNFHDAKIVAGRGWTTRNLLVIADERDLEPKYDLVSLLIGVNNQYRGDLFTNFQREFMDLLRFTLKKAKSRNSIFVLSIPDYGITPFGGKQASISEEIDMYNSWIKKACVANNIRYYDITEISRQAENDLSLLASDNLHPSGKMYAEWVKMIADNPPEILVQ